MQNFRITYTFLTFLFFYIGCTADEAFIFLKFKYMCRRLMYIRFSCAPAVYLLILPPKVISARDAWKTNRRETTYIIRYLSFL